MLLNFWDSEILIQNFMDLYNLTRIQICNILRRLHFGCESDYVKIFCEETGIRLDEVDVAHGVEFLGKIVSTTVDDFEHLRSAGLLPLDVLLENDSPMKRHLENFQIEIRPSTHEFFYKRKRLYIPFYEGDCEWCVYGDERCRYDGQKYKNLWCTYLQEISALATKLYSDCSEIEMFLFAQSKSMLNYSTVKDYPEIFYTIEDFVRKHFKEDLRIGQAWSKIRQKPFIITVSISYDDISYRTDYIDGGTDGDEKFWNYENFCGGFYDYSDLVPRCFWDNIWLIDICLRLIHPFGETSEICAGIKHDTVIPFDKLRIELIDNA